MHACIHMYILYMCTCVSMCTYFKDAWVCCSSVLNIGLCSTEEFVLNIASNFSEITNFCCSLKVAISHMSVVVMVAGKSIFRVLYFSSIPNMEERGNRFCDCRESPIPSLLSLLLELLGNRSEKLLQPITLEVCVCVCVCVRVCVCACVRVCVSTTDMCVFKGNCFQS